MLRQIDGATDAQIVEDADLAAAGDERIDEMAADEPGSAGDEIEILHRCGGTAAHGTRVFCGVVTTQSASLSNQGASDVPRRSWLNS